MPFRFTLRFTCALRFRTARLRGGHSNALDRPIELLFQQGVAVLICTWSVDDVDPNFDL